MTRTRRSLLLAILTFALCDAHGGSSVRRVASTSCKPIPVRLALGITTQIVFEQEPRVTLCADKAHFKIVTNASSPRSLAVIPVIEGRELDLFRDARGALPEPKSLANALDRNFNTNLFVFFDNHNQLMLELRFVAKPAADYILKVTETFSKDCEL